MSGAPDFLRLLQHEQLWSTAHRQLRMGSAKGGSGNVLDVLLPQRISGSEAICGGIEYRIDCLAGTPDIPLKELIALPVEILLLTDSGKLRRVCGIVTEARAGNFDGGLAAYHLVVRDALAVMEKRVNSRIFRNLNELEILQVLCDEWRHSNPVLATAFEYEFDPLLDMRLFPAREHTMQHNETDAAFLRRLLHRRGISWYIRPGRCRTSAVDPAHDRVPAHTLVLFYNAVNGLRKNAADTVRYHREDATDGRDVITSWTAVRTLQPGNVTRHSWDYKNPTAGHFMTVGVRSQADQGSAGNMLAASLDDYVIDIPHDGVDADDYQRLGQLRMRRHEFESKCFYGVGNVRDFCAGEYFVLTGHPEVDQHPPAEREFVITQLQLEARNNLPNDLAARADRLFGGKGWKPGDDEADRRGLAQVHFTAVRRGVAIVPHFDPRSDLPQPQLQSAIVVGPPGEDVHCDALGRVKIRFPGMRAADHQHAQGAGASDGPADSAWVRVGSSWAGNGPGARQQSGTLSLPRVGSEVLVSFLGGDPDRPIIIGQLFNQISAPPAFSGVGNLPGNRYLSGTRTQEIRGQRGNQLRFDDTRGEISAQLASDHGSSELNLGWLAEPRANGATEPRGEGAELRSDQAVCIRGGQGVLITAERTPGAEEPQLARAGLVGILDVLEGIVDELGGLAEHHSGDEATSGLADLADKLRNWDKGSNTAPGASGGGAAVVAITAPAGIVIGSSDNLALGSEKKITVASAADTEISAGRNIFIRAARGLSAFAHALGIKLVAGRGHVLVETHQGNIEIRSSGRISLIAAEGIDLQAPSIRVVAKGAQTDWGNATISHQCEGTQVFKGAEFVYLGPGGGAPAGLDQLNMKSHTDERLVLRHLQTREPVPHQPYVAHLDDGRTIDGVTDEFGRTTLVKGDMLGRVRFEILPPDLSPSARPKDAPS